MAVTWRTTAANHITSGSSFTITEPTGAASGDFEFVCVMTGVSGSVTTPSGWTLFGSATGTPSTGAKMWIYYVTGGRGSSAPTLAFSCTVGGNAWLEWHANGVNMGGAAAIDASATSTLGQRNDPDCPSATAIGTADEAIAIGFNFDGPNTVWSPPLSPQTYTIRDDGSSGGGGICVASRTLSVSGAENPGSFTGGSGAADTWEATILLKISAGGTDVPRAPAQAVQTLTGRTPNLAHKVNLPGVKVTS